MSERIFFDVEEAISREVRRITFDDKRTTTETVLKDMFDVFTGELIHVPIEAQFYDSSADANLIQYPHFFVRLLKTREDRFTGRLIPEYGKDFYYTVPTSPAAYYIVLTDNDGTIASVGNTFTTSVYQARKIQVGYYLRLMNGNNIGTYTITGFSTADNGVTTITVSNTLVANLPALYYEAATSSITFTAPVDLNTVRVGDKFIDSLSNSFTITAIAPFDTGAMYVTISGSGTPSLLAGGNLIRTGNVFTNTDTSPVVFLIMDPTQPIAVNYQAGPLTSYGKIAGISPEIPLDLYYLVRIDNKERLEHIQVLNRMWEEFNPPRTALPIVERSYNSADEFLALSIPPGGSNIVWVADTTGYNLGDPIFIINDFHPTKTVQGDAFERPFAANIADIIPSNPNPTVLLANLIITNITGNVISLGTVNFGDPLAIGNDTIGYSTNNYTPADLSTITPGTILVYNPQGQGPSSTSITSVITAVDDVNSTITVDFVGTLQTYYLINITNPSNGQLILDEVVPDTYTIWNHSKIISNAQFRLFMFHFVDHVTKDIEGAQYWVNEFTFWVQVWVNRLEEPQVDTTVDKILLDVDTIDGEVHDDN
jgi:hypothetical protein